MSDNNNPDNNSSEEKVSHVNEGIFVNLIKCGASFEFIYLFTCFTKISMFNVFFCIFFSITQ